MVPSLMEEYEVFVPVNERIKKIKELLINALFDLSDGTFEKLRKYTLIDPNTGAVYQDHMILIDTDIRNAKKLVLN